MSEWQPIETAPRDGTVILLANAKNFAPGYLDFKIEPAEKLLGYGEGLTYPNGWKKIGPRFMELVPNPEAGKRIEWWTKNGCSAFGRDDEYWEGDDPLWFDPTHWRPMLEPPVIRDCAPSATSRVGTVVGIGKLRE